MSKLAHYIKSEDLDYTPDNKGLGYELYQCLQYNNDRICLYAPDTNSSVTYGELLRRSIRTALFLRSLGVSKDGFICICTHHHEFSFVPLIAAQFLCAKVSSIHVDFTVAENVHFMKMIRPKIIFLTESSLDNIKETLRQCNQTPKLVIFEQNFEEFLQPQKDEENFRPEIVDDIFQTAIMFFSSGTTGLPKGVCCNHYSLLSQIVTIPKFDEKQGFYLSNYHSPSNYRRTVLINSPLYWMSCIQFTLNIIFTGGTVVVTKEFDALKTWIILEKYKINGGIFHPVQAMQLLKVGKPDNFDESYFKFFQVGGTSVPEKLVIEIKKILPKTYVLQGYGQTEATGTITCFPLNYDRENQKAKSCGKLVNGFTVKIVDPDTEQPLGPNQKGELRYKTKTIMNGYYNMDSQDAFDAEGFFKTGDVAYYDEDLYFYICGRLKEVFKYQVWPIYPSAIEDVLLTHPSVKEALVFGIPHEEDNEHPMALVVINEDVNTTEEVLIRYVETKVPDKQRLRAGIKIVKEIPKTVTGKVARMKIRKLVLEGKL